MPMSLADLEKEVSRDPKIRLFFELAREYQKVGRIDEAQALCEKGLAIHPTRWPARILLAQAYLAKNEVAQAREMVERVLLALPDNVPANHLAADIYLLEGDRDRARRHYQIVELFDPGRPDVAEKLAQLASEPEPAAGAEVHEQPAAVEAIPSSGAGREEADVAPRTSEATTGGEPARADGGGKNSAVEPAAHAAAGGDSSAPLLVPGNEGMDAPEITATPSLKEKQEVPPEKGEQKDQLWEGDSGTQDDWDVATASFEREVLQSAPAEASGEEAHFEAGLVLPEPPGREDGARGEVVEEPAEQAEGGFNTVTLAALYEAQGFPEKAIEVYQRILIRDPENKEVRGRIRLLMQQIAGAQPEESPPVHQEDVQRALRRKRVLALENWLRRVREEGYV
ncbi:MAG: tetratricopeptide repeat protein [Acidobacteriota bacterium]